MKNPFTLIVGLLVVMFFLGYMFTFTVRYNEAVVVTTFGSASPESVYRGGTAEAQGLIGNLKFKWPWPIQEVKAYDTRIQIVESRLEQVATADRHTIIIDTYVSWRITEPLEFFPNIENVDNARRQLRQRMRDAQAAISQFTFDDLSNPDPDQVKIKQAETAMLQRLRDSIYDQEKPWGIEILDVGIKRTILPETVTEKVFAQMRTNRERLAENARSEGNARRQTIVDDAAADQRRIVAFATSRAESIRAEGISGAAEYYKVFADAPDLAIFLRKLDAYTKSLGSNSTIILDAGSQWGFELWAPQSVPTPGSDEPLDEINE